MKQLTSPSSRSIGAYSLCQQQTGMPPTRAEIASSLVLNPRMRRKNLLKALARKGVIHMMPEHPGIQLLNEELEDEDQGLPLIGRVATGEPILAEQHMKHTTKIDGALFHPQYGFFALHACRA